MLEMNFLSSPKAITVQKIYEIRKPRKQIRQKREMNVQKKFFFVKSLQVFLE